MHKICSLIKSLWTVDEVLWHAKHDDFVLKLTMTNDQWMRMMMISLLNMWSNIKTAACSGMLYLRDHCGSNVRCTPLIHWPWREVHISDTVWYQYMNTRDTSLAQQRIYTRCTPLAILRSTCAWGNTSKMQFFTEFWNILYMYYTPTRPVSCYFLTYTQTGWHYVLKFHK